MFKPYFQQTRRTYGSVGGKDLIQMTGGCLEVPARSIGFTILSNGGADPCLRFAAEKAIMASGFTYRSGSTSAW
jgi:hypothetical protein